MDSYDELMKMMMDQQNNTPGYVSDTNLQQGLLGVGLDNNSNSSEMLKNSMQEKNQANMQNMLATGQQGIQDGMQSSQALQNQRQGEMNTASQQASQALAKQMQEQAKQQAFMGNLFGKLIKAYL